MRSNRQRQTVRPQCELLAAPYPKNLEAKSTAEDPCYRRQEGHYEDIYASDTHPQEKRPFSLTLTMPHIHELYDFVVAFYIVHDQEVLLVNHPRYKKWIAPGGHVELNENPDEALYREIKEETGLEVEILSEKPNFKSQGHLPLLTPAYMDVHDANPPHRHISLTYFARSTSGDSVKSDEHTDMKWFADTELEAPEYELSAPIKFYARKAIERASLDQ
jgi:ADP-ribose pyrophosphatase YjhB (NUDIX family)